jgi:hypothetical protein
MRVLVLRQLLIWGIYFEPRAVRAARCASSNFASGANFNLSLVGNVNADSEKTPQYKETGSGRTVDLICVSLGKH